MAVDPIQRMTPEEYLTFERESPERHEYWGGEIFAMSGASERHNSLVSNLVIELGLQMRGRSCRIYSSDMRVAPSKDGPYSYPDVVALCGELRLLDSKRDTLLNPSVIFEVLSPTTEAFDRGEKFVQYRRIESLGSYLLVSQGAMRIERFERQVDGHWLLCDYTRPEEEIELPAIGCKLSLAAVYDQVALPGSRAV